MHPFDELKAYVGFDPTDSESLRAAWPVVAPELPSLTRAFYAAALRFEGSAAVLQSPEQVERLRQSLERWIEELFLGPHDHAYHARRTNIGRVHVRVRLPQQYMFTAMSVMRGGLLDILERELPPGESHATSRSVAKICDIELAIMLGAYITSRELGRLEELRDVIVSHLPMSVLVIDKAGKVTATTATRGPWLRPGDLIGLPLSESIVPSSLAQELQIRLDDAQKRRREVVVPLVEVDIGQERRTLRATLIPVEHELAGALLHIEDLTETLAYEARANAAEHLAQLGTLAASVAHEIRNPLAGISGVVQVVSSSMAEKDERRHALARVQEQIKRLGDLIGELLMFSRPILPSLAKVDVRTIAEQAATQARADAQSQGLHGAVFVEGADIGVIDPLLVSQVVANLVLNALQAGAQQVRVLVSSRRIHVVDDGPGVPVELRQKIFEPFFTTKTRGTGLGLSIARRMIDAMHGSLTLSPSPLGGAGFEISLPA